MSRCLRAGRPRAQGRTVYVSRARHPHSQEGFADGCRRDARAPRKALRCPAVCGRDARAPRMASLCPSGCGRDACAPRVAPSTSRGRDARAPRTMAAGGTRARPGRHPVSRDFPSRDQALQSLLPVRARARTAIPAHTYMTSSGCESTDPRFRFLQR